MSLAATSTDGGFEFNSYDPSSFVNAEADSERADISIDLGDFVDFTDGRLNLYVQEADAGYSAPGQMTLTDTRHNGGALSLPLGSHFTLGAKIDSREQDQGVDVQAEEYNVGYRFTDNWDLRVGYREDERTDNSIIVPLTQEQGVTQRCGIAGRV